MAYGTLTANIHYYKFVKYLQKVHTPAIRYGLLSWKS